jgi:hypothetical protein
LFGLDQWISGLGHGGSPAILLTVAVLLGLRHATDPDHHVAVPTLVATEQKRRARAACRLGLAWGLGHASSLLALGLPFVLVAALLPQSLRDGAEALIGIVIMLLALRLYRRWRAGAFHAHAHRHGMLVHRHLHPHQVADHRHAHRVRSPAAACGIGLVHGIGGSAGVALLLLAGIPDRAEAVAALVLFALAMAGSAAVLSAGLGLALGLDRLERPLQRAVPVLAASAFAFGLVYSVVGVAAL